MSKMDPKWEPRRGHFSIDFWVDLGQLKNCISGLLFIWFASLFFWLPRAFIFKFLATSSNVLASSVGVTKVTQKCDVARLLSSFPLCFCYLEPYFSSFWPSIFGVVSRVISELRSTTRWRECRRQLRY